MFRRRRKYIFAVKKDHHVRNTILAIVGIVLLIGVIVFGLRRFIRPIERVVTVEAGEEIVTAEAFLKDSQKAEPITMEWGEGGEPNWNVPGDYEVELTYGGKTYAGTIRVEDTTAPAARPREVTRFADEEGLPDPMEFVTDVQDVTEVTASYDGEPDMTKEGSQDVTILLTDAAGNETKVQSKLILTDDVEAPVIYGAVDRMTYLSAEIPLDDGIAVVDDRDPNPQLTVDDSAVIFGQRGTYPVTYTATDQAGHTTEVTVNVTVSYHRDSAVGIDRLYPAIDTLLAEITDDAMTGEEKCRAVYDWAKANVGWADGGSDRTAWTKEAYRALQRRPGESFTASALFHGCMLRLGYQDMMVRGEGGNYWNLVNFGEGWRHVDSSAARASLGRTVFLLTDDELAEISGAGGAYGFDGTLYPEAK